MTASYYSGSRWCGSFSQRQHKEKRGASEPRFSWCCLTCRTGALRRKGETMNIRKNVDYSSIFAALDAAMQSGLKQIELYCELGRLVSSRPEKGTAVAAAEYLQKQYPETTGFSPRNMRRMRDFYRLNEGNPDMLELAMQLGWTQNVVILEAELNSEERRWYLQAAKQFSWSKTELQQAIASDTYQQRMPDEPIANSDAQDAVSFPGKLVFKSRVGRFQRKQNGAAFLKTVERTAGGVLVDCPNHSAAGWRGEGLRRVLQLPGGQLKVTLPDNDLPALVPDHLCTQIGCQPVLLSAPEDHADGTCKTELPHRKLRHREHHCPIPETALDPDVLHAEAFSVLLLQTTFSNFFRQSLYFFLCENYNYVEKSSPSWKNFNHCVKGWNEKCYAEIKQKSHGTNCKKYCSVYG